MRWTKTAAALGIALSGAACSRGKEVPGRPTAASAATPSATPFVWPLEAPPDSGDGVAPRRGMIWIPAGTLTVGTARDRTPRVADEEMAGEPVTLSGFYMDEFAYPNEAGAIPKTGMSREEAAGLCTAQEKRLCTELEWEHACKGPSNLTYEYGDAYRAADCTMGVQSKLSPSGLRIACKSAFGVHDLHGGPWEWTQSPWRRGGDSAMGTARGGNAEAGELVGRCANAMAVAPSVRRADMGVRCCAGPVNGAQVVLAVTRGKTLDARYEDPHLLAALSAAVNEKKPSEITTQKPFKADRVWLWHPVGNEELLVGAGCAKSTSHLECGVGVYRAHSGMGQGGASDAGPPKLTLVSFASSGWWMAVVKTDHRDHDLWVYGGDGNSSFRRRVAYVWGRIALGEPERTSAQMLEE